MKNSKIQFGANSAELCDNRAELMTAHACQERQILERYIHILTKAFLIEPKGPQNHSKRQNIT